MAEKNINTQLKWILVIEIFFAGIYLALTRGLFVIYLVSIGSGIEGVSFVIFISAVISTIVSVLIYRYPTSSLKE